MRRGHQYHPRCTGRRKSSVSIDEVVAALRNEEFNEPKTPSASMDSQHSPSKLFPSSEKQNRSKKCPENVDGYQSGSSGNSSSSNKRYPRPRSYSSQGYSQTKKSVNDRLAFYQKGIDISPDSEETQIGPPKLLVKRRSSNKSCSHKLELTPTNRARRSLQDFETSPTKQSKRKPVLNKKSRDEGSDDWSKLRCTSALTEEVAERERIKCKKKDDIEIIFAEAVFRSDTLMRFNIIKNELHNIQKSQLRRAETDFSSFNKRIENQENDLDSWEQDLKLTQSTLVETSTAIENARKAKELAVDKMISYDECMNLLEERLREIRLEKK